MYVKFSKDFAFILWAPYELWFHKAPIERSQNVAILLSSVRASKFPTIVVYLSATNVGLS